MSKEIIDFLGKVTYKGDSLGTYMHSNRADGTTEIIGVIHGYDSDIERIEGKEKAELFQDNLGTFISDAINEKIYRESLLDPKLKEGHQFSDFKISKRLLNCLRAMELKYPMELTKISRKEITPWRKFGLKSQLELDEFMKSYGIKFLGE